MTPATAGGPSLRFLLGGVGFAVSAPARPHLRWLRESLRPHARPLAAGGTRPIRIALRVSPRERDAIRDRVRQAERCSAFMFDAGVTELPAGNDADGGLFLYDPEFRAAFAVSSDRRRAEIIAGEDGALLRVLLARVVREYVVNAAQSGPGFTLHAACFVAKGRPVVVAAPTAGGKSSLLCYACADGAADLLANDRVVIDTLGRGFRVRGVPVPVFLRRGTLATFPAIRSAAATGQLDYLSLPGEPPDRRALGALRRLWGRLPLSAPRLAAMLGARQVASASRPLLLLPRITRRPGTCVLQHLSPTAAWEELQGSLFGSRVWAAATAAFNPASKADGSALEKSETCRRFVAAVPVLRAEIGRDLYRKVQAAAWVAGVLEMSRESRAEPPIPPRSRRRILQRKPAREAFGRAGVARRRGLRRADRREHEGVPQRQDPGAT